MKHVLVLIALFAASCGQEQRQDRAEPAAAAVNDILASPGPVSKPPAVVPLPKDQAQLDRMILAGYTPHGTHLHPPGVKECPLSGGDEAVM